MVNGNSRYIPPRNRCVLPSAFFTFSEIFQINWNCNPIGRIVAENPRIANSGAKTIQNVSKTVRWPTLVMVCSLLIEHSQNESPSRLKTPDINRLTDDLQTQMHWCIPDLLQLTLSKSKPCCHPASSCGVIFTSTSLRPVQQCSRPAGCPYSCSPSCVWADAHQRIPALRQRHSSHPAGQGNLPHQRGWKILVATSWRDNEAWHAMHHHHVHYGYEGMLDSMWRCTCLLHWLNE